MSATWTDARELDQVWCCAGHVFHNLLFKISHPLVDLVRSTALPLWFDGSFFVISSCCLCWLASDAIEKVFTDTKEFGFVTSFHVKKGIIELLNARNAQTSPKSRDTKKMSPFIYSYLVSLSLNLIYVQVISYHFIWWLKLKSFPACVMM